MLRTEGTLDRVQGNARLAEAPLAEEVAAALDATDKDVEIGGAGLAGGALELGLVDELHIFRNPVLVGGGTPLLPPVTKHVPLDLIETRTFGSRVIYERYGRARDESGLTPPASSVTRSAPPSVTRLGAARPRRSRRVAASIEKTLAAESERSDIGRSWRLTPRALPKRFRGAPS